MVDTLKQEFAMLVKELDWFRVKEGGRVTGGPGKGEAAADPHATKSKARLNAGAAMEAATMASGHLEKFSAKIRQDT